MTTKKSSYLYLIITLLILVSLKSCVVCDTICEWRVNYKAGDFPNNEEGFGRFTEGGSGSVCSNPEKNPKFVLKITNSYGYLIKVYETDGKDLGPNGHNPWKRTNCIDRSTLESKTKPPQFSFEPKENSSQSITVKDKRCPNTPTGNTCLVYKASPMEYRTTFKTENCGVNIDVKFYPFKNPITKENMCVKCNC